MVNAGLGVESALGAVGMLMGVWIGSLVCGLVVRRSVGWSIRWYPLS